MRKYTAILCCVFLLTLLSQAGNAQAVELSATRIAEIQKLAEQGNINAQLTLGWIYYVGKHDYSKGIVWYMKAVDQLKREAIDALRYEHEKYRKTK